MAVTKKDKSADKLVINQLVLKTPNRTTSDVGKWRDALKAADKGKVKQLYDLFDDLTIDGVLGDAIDKRIDAVKLAALTFQDENGEEVEEITNLIDSPGFENLLETIMQVKFWGRAGGEFNFSVENGFQFEPLPAKHIKLETNSIIINDTDETGIDYTADDHLLVLGRPRKFGLLLKAAPYAIWKRGGFGDWAEWLEVFGIPQRIGKYSSSDPESRQLLEEAFETAGSAPWMVVPKETEVEQKVEGGNSNSGGSFNDFRKACNEEMLITILGQTMTTLDGSSRSQSETHKDVEDSKHKSDMRFAQRILNYFVKPLLEKRGFPVANGGFTFPDDNEAITVEELVQLSDIIEIPATYVHERYGIPQAADDDQLARRAAQPTLSYTGGDTEPVENSDRNLFLRLFDFFQKAPAATEATGAYTGNLIKLNDEQFTDRLIKQVIAGDKWSIELFEFVSNDLLMALDAKPVKLADLGFKYNHQNDAFRTAMEMNVYHFSAAKTLAEITDLNDIYRESKGFDDFYKKASARADVFNKTWQRTEFQSATLIAESTANYNRLSQKTDLFPYWEYRTMGDDKVRDEHAALNGLILPANDPRWRQIWPPNGWKCRCYIVPRMAHEVEGLDLKAQHRRVDDYFDTPDWKTAKGNGFDINRALSPEVFSKNQQYIKKFPTRAKKLLEDINYQTHKLGSYAANRKKANGNASMYQGTINDYVNGLKTEDGKTFFTDYANRSLEFNLNQYLKGHKNKLNERVPYIKAAAEAIKMPDEVWINGTKAKAFNQYVFVKYYNDVAIIAIASVDKGKYVLKTWFPAHELNKNIKYKFRSGLLIKKPL